MPKAFMKWMRKVTADMDFLLGIASIQLKSLTFKVTREKVPAAVSLLRPVFRQNCQPSEVPNRLPVYILTCNLQQLLQESGISLEAFSSPQTEYPRLRSGLSLECLHGRQRYEAAVEEFGSDYWWTIKLYCLPEGSNPYVLLREELNQSFFETAYSDGEIFKRVWEHKQAGEGTMLEAWIQRLTDSKQVAMRRLINDRDIALAMYNLCRYPGLRHGLELGNIQRDLATRCREEIIYHLRRALRVWKNITLNRDDVCQATDINTVRHLERLTPFVSHNDRREIGHLMSSRCIFEHIVTPSVRQAILSKLLETEAMIPSIKTFHENVKYLDIGMRILRQFIVGKLRPRETMFQAMSRLWRPAGSLLEYQNNQFCDLTFPADMRICYLQIFMSAVRKFPGLSDVRPIRDFDDNTETIDHRSALRDFLLSAMALGFRSPTMETMVERIGTTAREEDSAQILECTYEIERKRRCGRPSGRSFRFISRNLFLSRLRGCDSLMEYPQTLFIQKDFLHSFFEFFHFAQQLANDASHPVVATYSDAQSQSSISSSAQFSDLLTNSLMTTLATSNSSHDMIAARPDVLAAAAAALEHRNEIRGSLSESSRSFIIPPESPGRRVEDRTSMNESQTSTADTSWGNYNSLEVRERAEGERSSSSLIRASYETDRTLLIPN